MNSSVFQLLFQFDGVISEKQIQQALHLEQNEELDELRTCLDADDRFIGCSDACWKCAPLDTIVEDKPINEVTFVITDIETTGSIKGSDRIIEIAAAKVRNGQVIGNFESLVNPQKKISTQISRLTKITNQTVENAPLIEEVLPEFKAFADGNIFVAHNALFDFLFIQAELERLGMDAIKPQIEICTYRLARRLLPDVKARGINGLSVYFNYQLENRHRALPDVKATTFFLQKFLDQLEKKGVQTLYQLIEYQRERLNKRELLRRIKRQQKKNLTANNENR